MTLREAIDRYIAWQRSHGAKFESSAFVLNLFLKSIDEETACDAVTRSQVRIFLAGKGPLTRYRENKYGALAGFYRCNMAPFKTKRSAWWDCARR